MKSEANRKSHRVASVACAAAVAASLAAVGGGLASPGNLAYASPDAPCDEPALASAGYLGFPDVDSDAWYVESGELDYALSEGLLQGYDNGAFGPEDSLTRAQAATILWRMAGEPSAVSSPFADVKHGAWYYEAVSWAAKTEVVHGDANGKTFRPDDPISRQELACMMANYAEFTLGSAAGLSSGADIDGYPDAWKVADWAKASMRWCVAREIFGGAGELMPEDEATRCQAAKIFSQVDRGTWKGEASEDGLVTLPATAYSNDEVIGTVKILGVEPHVVHWRYLEDDVYAKISYEYENTTDEAQHIYTRYVTEHFFANSGSYWSEYAGYSAPSSNGSGYVKGDLGKESDGYFEPGAKGTGYVFINVSDLTRDGDKPINLVYTQNYYDRGGRTLWSMNWDELIQS